MQDADFLMDGKPIDALPETVAFAQRTRRLAVALVRRCARRLRRRGAINGEQVRPLFRKSCRHCSEFRIYAVLPPEGGTPNISATSFSSALGEAKLHED